MRRRLEESVMAERQAHSDTKPEPAEVIRMRRAETDDLETVHDEASRIGVAAVARALEERAE
jgi:hypothetical protein